jgi:hypothetical protein
MKKVILFLAVVIFLLGGCSNAPPVSITPVETSMRPEPYFPVQAEEPRAYMLVLLPGKLVMDKDGYLRVNDALVLWPYGYSLITEGDDIWILTGKGVKAFRVGDNITLGGGFIPDEYVAMKIGHALPEGCTGSFFLANPIPE